VLVKQLNHPNKKDCFFGFFYAEEFRKQANQKLELIKNATYNMRHFLFDILLLL